MLNRIDVLYKHLRRDYSWIPQRSSIRSNVPKNRLKFVWVFLRGLVYQKVKMPYKTFYPFIRRCRPLNCASDEAKDQWSKATCIRSFGLFVNVEKNIYFLYICYYINRYLSKIEYGDIDKVDYTFTFRYNYTDNFDIIVFTYVILYEFANTF